MQNEYKNFLKFKIQKSKKGNEKMATVEIDRLNCEIRLLYPTNESVKKLAEEVVDPEDIETLEDLVAAALGEALRKVEEASNASMEQLTGGLGGLGGGFPF